MSRPLLQLSEGDPVIDPLIDPLQNPVILLRIAHGIEAEAKEVETGTATMMTRGQEVEGELVQDHHPQEEILFSAVSDIDKSKNLRKNLSQDQTDCLKPD